MTKHTILSFLLVLLAFNTNAQNVGIDVPEPLGKLHIKVNSTTLTPQLRLTEDGADFARIKLESNAFPLAFWDIAARSDTSADNSFLNFFYDNSSIYGDRMTIRGNGNIGINNNNPVSKLDIKNIGNGKELLRFTTDRPWVFKQTDSGINTRLTLQSTINDKTFDIVAPNGTTKMAEFLASDTDPEVHILATVGRMGIGTNSVNNKVTVIGEPTSTNHVLSVSSSYVGDAQIRAIEGFSSPAIGKGYGGYFQGGYRGAKANAEGGSYSGLSIGVEGSAYGTAGTRIGIFGRGIGGSTNWAGYFAEGHVYVTNELRIGSGAIGGALGYKVAVDGKLIAEEVRVQSSGAWPDYVFEKEYSLKSLEELEQEIENHGHLPGVPSAEEVSQNGIMLGEMQKILLEKIEELTLYTIELQKQVSSLQSELNSIKAKK